MISKVTILGLVIIVLSLIPLILVNLIGISFPWMASQSPEDPNLVQINSGNSVTTSLVGIPGHPLHVQITVVFLLSSNDDIDCDISIIYQNPGSAFDGSPVGNTKYIYDDVSGWRQKSITRSLPPPHSSSSFSVALKIDNQGTNTITLANRRVRAVFTLTGLILPAIILLVGIILAVFGFIKARGPAVSKPKAVPGGWEPTLQWGGGAGGAAARKQPKMAIKSTKGAKPAKKTVVKKAAPAGGAQQACKFCGKQVPASAFFCPHCYGKLR